MLKTKWFVIFMLYQSQYIKYLQRRFNFVNSIFNRVLFGLQTRRVIEGEPMRLRCAQLNSSWVDHGLQCPTAFNATIWWSIFLNNTSTEWENALINRCHWHSVHNGANRFCIPACGANVGLFLETTHIQSMEQRCSTVRARRFYEIRTRSYLFMEACVRRY